MLSLNTAILLLNSVLPLWESPGEIGVMISSRNTIKVFFIALMYLFECISNIGPASH